MQFNATLRKAISWSGMSGVLLAGLVGAGCNRQPESAPASATEVGVIKVEQRSIVSTTELPGRTSPYRVAEIRPQVNGLIQKRMFTEGADVQAGEVLYQIDPAPFQAALDNARAALSRSEANLPSIRARAERYQGLVAEKAVSQQEYDDAAAALRQNEADIQSWKAMLQTAQINLGYTRIIAPITGRIGRSNVTEGAIVTAYQPLALATIQQLDPIYVDVQQSATELLRLQRLLAGGQLNQNGGGQQAVKLIIADGVTYPLEGTLQFRDITVEPSTGSVTLRAVFPNPEAVLLPGMFVQAVVKEGTKEHEILIPQQAVSRDHKGDPMVWIVDAGDQAQQRKLILDRAIDDQWLVTEGLEPGDQVIVEGLQRVRPGVKVKAVPVQLMPVNGAPAAPQSN